MNTITHTSSKSLIIALVLGASVSALAMDNDDYPHAAVNNRTLPLTFDEIRLFDWHGRPKRMIGEDQRTYRQGALLRRHREPTPDGHSDS